MTYGYELKGNAFAHTARLLLYDNSFDLIQRYLIIPPMIQPCSPLAPL